MKNNKTNPEYVNVKVTVMDTTNRTFANDMLIAIKVAKHMPLTKQIKRIKEKALKIAKDKSGLSRFAKWSFKAFCLRADYNPSLNTRKSLKMDKKYTERDLNILAKLM